MTSLIYITINNFEPLYNLTTLLLNCRVERLNFTE